MIVSLVVLDLPRFFYDFLSNKTLFFKGMKKTFVKFLSAANSPCFRGHFTN
jgi:hypothetical protein